MSKRKCRCKEGNVRAVTTNVVYNQGLAAAMDMTCLVCGYRTLEVHVANKQEAEMPPQWVRYVRASKPSRFDEIAFSFPKEDGTKKEKAAAPSQGD